MIQHYLPFLPYLLVMLGKIHIWIYLEYLQFYRLFKKGVILYPGLCLKGLSRVVLHNMRYCLHGDGQLYWWIPDMFTDKIMFTILVMLCLVIFTYSLPLSLWLAWSFRDKWLNNMHCFLKIKTDFFGIGHWLKQFWYY